MSKSQSNNFLNVHCIVESKLGDIIKNYKSYASSTYVPVKKVHKTGVKAGLLAALGGYALGNKTTTNNAYIIPLDSEESHSLYEKLSDMIKDYDHEK